MSLISFIDTMCPITLKPMLDFSYFSCKFICCKNIQEFSCFVSKVGSGDTGPPYNSHLRWNMLLARVSGMAPQKWL